MSDDLAKVRTVDFPFGADTDTLIICKNQTHSRQVANAFQMKARYAHWFGSLIGFRAKKIIVFWPAEGDRNRSYQDYIEFYNVHIRTRLAPGGEIIEV